MDKINKLVEQAGGRRKVMYDLDITNQAIAEWGRQGLPKKHWPYFMEQAGIDANALWEIDDAIMRWSRRSRKRH